MAITETCNELMSSDSSPDELLESAEGCRTAGNDLLNKGDYADACTKYDQGLLALTRVGDPHKERVDDLRLALHLNASLAHLRRSNLRSAVDHASGALAIDSNNEKGLFRRASAQSRLSEHPGHEENAKLAMADFEKVIQLNPDNKDAAKQLRLLRAHVKKEQQDLAKSQRDTYKNIFSGGKQLYDDVSSTKATAPVIYTDWDALRESHRCLVAVEQVAFHYVRGEPVLEAIHLELRASRCIGLFGNNATGKTTLARLLCNRLSPVSGGIAHYGRSRQAALAETRSLGSCFPILSIMAAAVVAVVAIMFAVASRVSSGLKLADSALLVMTSMGLKQVAVVVFFAVALAMLVKLALDSRKVQNARHSVLHVSSEASDKEDISGTKSIEHLIGEKLPKHLLPSERQRRVIAMLKAAGFQMYNQETGEPVGNPEEYIRDKLKYGALSGGQRHLMYVLRNLAAAPDVLVCDELLGGLDAFRQPRVLHMLRRMKEEMHTSILYISTELSQLRLISDDIGYLSGGVICELGPAEALLDGPKHPHTKEYVSSYRSLPGCHVIGGKLAENYTALLGDADIEGEWLPA